MAAVQSLPVDSHMCPSEHCSKSADDNPAIYPLAASSWGGWEAAAADYGDVGSTTSSSLPSDILADACNHVICDNDPLSDWLSSFNSQPTTSLSAIEKHHTSESTYTRLMFGADFNLRLSHVNPEKYEVDLKKPACELLTERSFESGSESSLIDTCRDFVREDHRVRSSASSSQVALVVASQTPLPFTCSPALGKNANPSTSPNSSMESVIASNISLPECRMTNTPRSYLGAWDHHNSSAVDAWATFVSSSCIPSGAFGHLPVTGRINLMTPSCTTEEYGAIEHLMASAHIVQQQADIGMHRPAADIPFPDHLGTMLIAPHVVEQPQLQIRNQTQLSGKPDHVSTVSTDEGAVPSSTSVPKSAVQAQERKAAFDRTGKRQREDPMQDIETPPLKQHCNASPFSQESTNLDLKSEDKPTNLSLTTTASSYSADTAAVGPALNTNGRPRARRGSATDPQSVYARHRRERINERLKILQNLVPNGAKVDIVTMLEEAINYVKFLQLQVKLLSSDEYWMYAPTTYNGIDVSFDMHIGLQNTS